MNVAVNAALGVLALIAVGLLAILVLVVPHTYQADKHFCTANGGTWSWGTCDYYPEEK